MFELLRRLFGSAPPTPPETSADEPVATTDAVVRCGESPLDLRRGADHREGFVHPDWDSVWRWLDELPEHQRAQAWLQCERTWLGLVRDALGPRYRLHESDRAFLLSAQEPGPAAATPPASGGLALE